MLKAGDVLDMGPIQMKMTIKKVTSETLDVELELEPHAVPNPVHIHPHAIETYEVLEGLFDAYVDGVWKTYKPGERVEVPRGVPHTFRNSSEAKTRVHNSHQPALNLAEYFEGLHKIANSGVVKDGKMTFRAMLHLSLLMVNFKNEIVPINPPAPVASLFGFMAKLAGYRI